MRVEQWVGFALFSSRMTAVEMTARLGIEPDAWSVRGSRRAGPSPVPAAHTWRVECRRAGTTIDEQVAAVLARLRPRTTELADLVQELTVADADAGAALEVVRYFDSPEGDEEHLDPPDASLQKLRGQHQLLGWHLDQEALTFLATVGADLDVDEYR